MRRLVAKDIYTSVFEHSPDAVFLARPDGTTFAANPAACELLGRSEEEICRLGRAGLIDPDSEELQQILDERERTGRSRGTVSLIHADATLIPVELVSSGFTDAGGDRWNVVTAHDLRSRRQVQDALSGTQLLLDTIVNTTQDFIWSVHPDDFGILWFNDALRDYFAVGRGIQLTAGMTPDDLFEDAHFRQYWRDLYRRALTLGRAEEEYRVAAGTHVLALTVTAMNRDGQCVGISVFGRDVTDQKRAEAELQVAATAFEESQEAMLVTDADTTILRVNRAFVELTGYSPEEAVGQTPRLLSSGRQGSEFYEAMWTSLHQHQRWQGEIWNRRRSGEVYPEWLSITSVLDKAGQVVNYVASFTDLSGVKKAERDIHTLSFYDPLTGLPNRVLLGDRARQAILSTNRAKGHGCVMFLDLDDFTILNDTRGHTAGDQLLREVARRLTQSVHPDDTVARLGSDEFAVVIDALAADPGRAAQQAQRLAERLRAALAGPFDIEGEPYQCRASIGIAMFSGGQPALPELLKRADSAVRQAKHGGRDAAHFYNPDMQAALERRVRVETALRNATDGRLRLAYQPQVNDHGDVIGAEVLLRWNDPELGEVPPATFIPLAEESGLILQIGRWVLEQACETLKRWEAHPRTRHLVLAVNVSAKQIHEDAFVTTVLEVLSRSGADPSRLELQLTENLLVHEPEAVAKRMLELRSYGVRFSLDDFGTGFSSLRSLGDLPLHQLKIDQSFVRELATDVNSSAIVRTTIALGQSLGIAVIAEGVETPEQHAILKTLGCTSFQGFLFGRPDTVEVLEAMIGDGPTIPREV